MTTDAYPSYTSYLSYYMAKAKKILGWGVFLVVYVLGIFYFYSQVGVNNSGCRGECFDVITPGFSLLEIEIFLFVWLIFVPLAAKGWLSIKRRFSDPKLSNIADWILILVGLLVVIKALILFRPLN